MTSAAYLVKPKKSVVALHDGKFHEYTVIECEDGVSSEFDEDTRLVSVSVRASEVLMTRIIEFMPEEKLRYLVLDLDRDSLLTQVVGVAEEDYFGESAVGTIHLFV